ncbi:expressed unknown protein [Seminavis robusta]|uniref:Uncharacterized protein n=1 Tax=Seminavis robusta TaxID=568900 RepID=A0A9N8DTS6_9STRA|nr:expressed unknown protein [Seminavis robusta]|eukprot:Sro365_g127400.1 n/a (159) ;mRNA; r:41334-41810
MGNSTSSRADKANCVDQLVGLEVVFDSSESESNTSNSNAVSLTKKTSLRLKRVLSRTNSTRSGNDNGLGGRPSGSSHKGKSRGSTSSSSARDFMECLAKLDPQDIANIMQQCQEDAEEGTVARSNTSLEDYVKATTPPQLPAAKVSTPKLKSCRNTAA